MSVSGKLLSGILALLVVSTYPVRAEIVNVNVQPRASGLTHETHRPWHSLLWKATKDQLTVTNTGTVAVQIATDLILLPDEMVVSLRKTTILPGETLEVYGACPEHLPAQKEVLITPLAEDKHPLPAQVLPLQH